MVVHALICEVTVRSGLAVIKQRLLKTVYN